MGDFLKRGFIEFKTLAPVFIGSGNKVNKKEYLFDTKTGTIIVLQMNRVFDRINALGLADEFEKYLLAPGGRRGSRYGNGLIDFVRDNHIPESEYSTWSEEVLRFADRSMDFRSVKDIQLFVRNERGLPYVPGSGFKGMLRTVLETDYFLRNREEADEMAEQIRKSVRDNTIRPQRRDRYMRDEDAMIDVRSMHREMFAPKDRESPASNLRDQKNDMLRGLIVGDSEALCWEDMCVCEKIDLPKEGDAKRLNVYREAIRPGVTVRIPISIDTRICRYSTRDILIAIKNFNENYQNCFSGPNLFSDAPGTRGNSTTFFLGGGTGYVSKTVTYGILSGRDTVATVSKIIDATLGPDARRKHGHYNDERKEVSPHMLKCTMYNGKLLQMGACCVTGYQ